MKKIVTIPTIIGIFFLLAGIATGLILIQGTKSFRAGASPDLAPKDVRISNITDNSVAISWVTDSTTQGFVKYGSGSSLDKTALSEIGRGTTHYVVLRNLEATTRYAFKIVSGDIEFDSNGSAWETTTGADIGQPESNIIISGNVKNKNNLDIDGVIVYAQMPNGTSLSTFTSREGNWLLTISNSRALPNLTTYTTIDIDSTNIELFVQGGSQGISTGKIVAETANPTPTITLGQTFDFTKNNSKDETNIPESTLNLPISSDTTSRFQITEASSTPATTVTLDSHEEGEVITNDSPQFFGEGPPGTSLTITVESDPITTTTQIGANGNWSWSLPTDLEPGTHKITMSWRDVSGILRTLTRNFEVKAAEGPAFVASGSATLTPSPSAVATATPRASTIPNSTPLATGSALPIPVSGSLTPTIMLFMMSVGVLSVSAFLAFKAF